MLFEFRCSVPILPSRCRANNEEAEFVASVHKSRILWIMCISYDFHAGCSKFQGITPMHAVCQSIANDGEILVPVCTNQFGLIRFSVEPQSVCALKFDTSDADSLIVAIHRMTFVIFDTDIHFI